MKNEIKGEIKKENEDVCEEKNKMEIKEEILDIFDFTNPNDDNIHEVIKRSVTCYWSIALEPILFHRQIISEEDCSI